jgi:pilus assembly protein FimV
MVPVKPRFAVALLILLLSAPAWAALGKIHVHSHLGEPFSGEIVLTGVAGDMASGLKVGLASRTVFRHLNVEPAAVLDTLRFAVRKTPGGATIHLSSPAPIADPYLHFVLEARTSAGVERREYVVLLDPLGEDAPLSTSQPAVRAAHAHVRRAVAPHHARVAQARVVAPAVPMPEPVPPVKAAPMPVAAVTASAAAPAPAASTPAVDEAQLQQLRGKIGERELALKQERLRIAGLEQQLLALQQASAPPPWWKRHLREIAIGAGGGLLLVLVALWAIKQRRARAAAKAVARPKPRNLITEADECLARGDDLRAEDLLKEALLYESMHQEARQRLLDLYAARPDTVRFEALAREVHAHYDGRGAAWQRVAAQGLAIDPNNPLYQPGGVVLEATTPASAPRDTMLELDVFSSAGSAPEPMAAATRFDLSDSLMAAPEAPAPAADKGNDMLDFDFAIESPAPGVNAAAPLTVATPPEALDLAPPPDFAAMPAASPAAADEGMDAGSTKLDLARVYLDMGDRDGAREVLGDLIRESQGKLKEQAEALLASIV